MTWSVLETEPIDQPHDVDGSLVGKSAPLTPGGRMRRAFRHSGRELGGGVANGPKKMEAQT